MRNFLILGVALVAVAVVWILPPIVGYICFPTWPERAQFGDLLGASNGIFSGLAFAGLIYAIYLQRQDLSLQRKELELQRNEMAASRGELAAQVAAMIGQIKVAALQARIEADKVEAEGKAPSSKYQFAEKITEKAEAIDVIAKGLDRN